MSNAALSAILNDLARQATQRTSRTLIQGGPLRIVDMEISPENAARRDAAAMLLDLIREHRPDWLQG